MEQFLQHDAFSIVVKGKAGTGKTALALTILTKSIGKQPCLYISSRLSIGELFEYYPWVKNFAGDSKKDFSPESPDGAVEAAPFVDARLDEPSALFERITNELMDTSSPLIIIDTWDAVGDFMDKEALITNAKILQIWRQRSRAKLVFVLESTEDKTFDNLVDGVIELEEKYVESRKTRRIHLSKLRGIKITKPWSFFTLNAGVFHSFDRYNLLVPLSVPRQNEEKGDQGFPDDKKKESAVQNPLEIILGGGIPKHTVVNLELDKNVNPKLGLVFLGGIIVDFARKNGVLLLPPKGVPDTYVDQFLKIILRNSEQRKRVSVLKNSPGNDTSSSIGEEIKQSIGQMKKKEPNGGLFGAFSLGPSLSKKTLDLELVKTLVANGLEGSVLITFSNESITEEILNISDVSMRLREIEGTLFVQPEKPWASFFAIENGNGNEIISVQPMV
ncbi:MAG: RAD55 family ATPase [Nitrososphaerales archaeon]